MVDRVRPLKQESPSDGGTQTDTDPTGLNRNQDYMDARGVAMQDAASNDALCLIDRDTTGQARFTDPVNGIVLLGDLRDVVPIKVATGSTYKVPQGQVPFPMDIVVDGAVQTDGFLVEDNNTGLTGATGPAGISIRTGYGAPGPALGNDGDLYLNQSTNQLVGPKAGGVWPAALGVVPTAFTMEALVRSCIQNGQKKHVMWTDSMASVDLNNYYFANSTGGAQHIYTNTYYPGAGTGYTQLSTLAGSTNFEQMVYGYGCLLGRFKRYRTRTEFFIPVLSTDTDTFITYHGQFQGGAGARTYMTLKYSHNLNGGRFQLLYGFSPIDTGVTVQAGVVYAMDTYMEVTTPGNTASNPYVVQIIDVAANNVLATLTGNGLAGVALGSSLDTGLVGNCITKTAGTTPCLLNVTFLSAFAEFP